MIERRGLATADPLGLGGLLMDACRLDRLLREDVAARTGGAVEQMRALRRGCSRRRSRGWRIMSGESDLERPAVQRLAFRELGLAIGLAAIERMAQNAASDAHSLCGAAAPGPEAVLERLARFVPLADRIEASGSIRITAPQRPGASTSTSTR